jgi:hypothetical protein
MHWIAPSERDNDNGTLEKRLWAAADQLRANSGLKAQEYSGPIPGIAGGTILTAAGTSPTVPWPISAFSSSKPCSTKSSS